MMAVTGINWHLCQGEDGSLRLTGIDKTDPTGWVVVFTLATYPGNPVSVLTYYPAVSGPDTNQEFTLTITLTRAQTLALLDFSVDGYSKKYFWDVWRADTGENTVLASGTLLISAPSRLAI